MKYITLLQTACDVVHVKNSADKVVAKLFDFNGPHKDMKLHMHICSSRGQVKETQGLITPNHQIKPSCWQRKHAEAVFTSNNCSIGYTYIHILE